MHIFLEWRCLTISCGLGVHILLAMCNWKHNEGCFPSIWQETQVQHYHVVDVVVFITEILHELLKSTFLSTNLKKKNEKVKEDNSRYPALWWLIQIIIASVLFYYHVLWLITTQLNRGEGIWDEPPLKYACTTCTHMGAVCSHRNGSIHPSISIWSWLCIQLNSLCSHILI